MDDVTAIEDVVKNETCSATAKWTGHGENSPLGRLEPPDIDQSEASIHGKCNKATINTQDRMI